MKEIFAEVITIGDEILFGQITDTNSQWISAELDKIGIKTRRKTSVSDKEPEIVASLKEAETRADIILMTGGLGPTKDDLTKGVLARYFGVGLERDDVSYGEVKAYFEKRGRVFDELNCGQAELPTNCTRVQNKYGTAPGMWFEENDTIYVSMPGVPFEMKAMITNTVLGRLKEKFALPAIHHKMIRTVGIGESWLADKISDWEDNLPENIKLAYLPGMWQVRLRLTGVGSDKEQLEQQIEDEFAKVYPLIEQYVFGYETTELEEAVGTLLKEKGLSIGFAESCTGGYISHLITSVPGSSEYLKGSVVAYSNDVKIAQLGLKKETLDGHGAVSEETALEMAEGVRNTLGTDIGFSSTGIAGPDGGTEEKPVGTIWIAFSSKEKTKAIKLNLGGTRDLNIKYTAVNALNLIRLSLTNK
ncbi:MAG: competence/damage-inducible protein A [Cyclobacteriaceae bacterium]